MIIIGTPKDVENYILVTNDESIILHKMGFIPQYRDNKGIYYKKTIDLQDAYGIVSQY